MCRAIKEVSITQVFSEICHLETKDWHHRHELVFAPLFEFSERKEHIIPSNSLMGKQIDCALWPHLRFHIQWEIVVKVERDYRDYGKRARFVSSAPPKISGRFCGNITYTKKKRNLE